MLKCTKNKFIKELHVAKIAFDREKFGQSQLNNRELSEFRSIAGCLNWAASTTRPELLFDVLDLSTRVTSADISSLNDAYKSLIKLQRNQYALLFPDLGMREWKMVVFSDGSHAKLMDGFSSAFGHIILLVGVEKCCPLAWKASKIQQVVKSTLAAEAFALGESLDCSYFMKKLIVEVSKKIVGIFSFIDNKPLFDNLRSTKFVTKKRLRIDLASIKQMVEKKEVVKVHWINHKLQLADVFT